MSWVEKNLKEYINVESGAAFKSEEFVETGIPVVKIANINNHTTIETKSDSFIKESDLDKYKDVILNYDDILIAMSGNTTCKMGRVSKKFSPSLLNQRVGWIKPISEEIDINFVYHLLISDAYQKRLWTFATATGQPNLSPRDIRRISFLKPPKPEQTAIATILSKVDEAIEAVRQSIKTAEKLKKALMQNLLTGKIKPDGTWRKDDDFYKDEKFGKYPKSWNFSRFKDYAVLQRGKDLTDKEVVSGIYPVVKSNGVKIRHNQYFVEPPGVVTGRSGTIGKVFYIEEKFWSHNTSLYVKDFKGNNPRFIYYLIQRMDFRKYYAGTTVPTLNRNDIHRLKIAMPKTFEEQEKIANSIDEYDNLLQQKQTKIKTLQRLKKSLMQNLLTGKIRVNYKLLIVNGEMK